MRRNSFSNAPGVGSRLAQNSLMNRASSGTDLRARTASSSLYDMQERTGPPAHRLMTSSVVGFVSFAEEIALTAAASASPAAHAR